MNSLAERIQTRLDDLGLTPAVVARRAGLKPDYIRDVLRGVKHSISARHAPKLAEVLQCDLAWLLSGERLEISSEDVAASLPGGEIRENNGASSLQHYRGEYPGAVPEVDARAGAGVGQVGEFEVVTLKHGNSYVGHKVISEWVFPVAFLRHELRVQPTGIMVLEVVGDSMSPTLETGDRVLVDTNHVRPTPDGIYVIDEGDGPLVKRLQVIRRSEPQEVRIISDNKNHEPYTLRAEDLRVVGRVSGRLTKM